MFDCTIVLLIKKYTMYSSFLDNVSLNEKNLPTNGFVMFSVPWFNILYQVTPANL